MGTAVGSVLEAAVETYNEYRSPMATAELLDAEGEAFEVTYAVDA